MNWPAYLFIGVAGVAMVAAMPADLQPVHHPAAKYTLPQPAHQNVQPAHNPLQRQQQFQQDSYLEALEYSHNSAAIQGTDGPTGLASFFRTSTFLNPDGGLTRTGMATAFGLPIAALAGLALLAAPIAIGRRRRDLDEPETTSYMDIISTRVQNIYGQVLQSDECMERLVCELGSMAKNIYYKDSLIGVASAFAPDTYRKHMSTFKTAAYTGDTAKCRKIKCTPIGL